MSDYVVSQDYSDKDLLASGDPEKLILGADLEIEFAAIAVAIASKYDSSDVASTAQAQAAVSNSVLMTPAKVTDWAQYNSGILYDLQLLADPNADRLVFWDDSAGAGAFLTLGTGLTITDTTIAVSAAAVDHNTLLNYVADQHIAHSGVTLTAGEGLSGGGTIAASRSFALSISGLTAETVIDTAADYLVMYDASAAAHRKVLASGFFGTALGDGKWYLTADLSIGGSPTTIASLTADYDSLTRGTFSAAAGTYTAGADGARILVFGSFRIDNVNSGSSAYVLIQVDGVDVAHARMSSAGGSEDTSLAPITTLNLSNGQVVRFRSGASSGETITAGKSTAYIGIVELA